MISFRQSDLIDRLKNIGKKIRFVPQDGNRSFIIRTIDVNGFRDDYVFILNGSIDDFKGKKLCLLSGGCLGKITSIKDGIFYTDDGHAIKSEEHGYYSANRERIVI